MDIQQIRDVVLKIRTAYPQTARDSDIKEMLKFYAEMLKGQEYKVINENLRKHILTSEYPPKIADLVKKTDEVSNTPTKSETEEIFKRLDAAEKNACPPVRAKEWIDKIAETLGVDKHEC